LFGSYERVNANAPCSRKKLSRLPVRSAVTRAKRSSAGSKRLVIPVPDCGDTRDPAEFARAIKEVEDAIEKLKRHFARVKKTAEN
jgi:hypothetical protein